MISDDDVPSRSSSSRRRSSSLPATSQPSTPPRNGPSLFNQMALRDLQPGRWIAEESARIAALRQEDILTVSASAVAQVVFSDAVYSDGMCGGGVQYQGSGVMLAHSDGSLPPGLTFPTAVTIVGTSSGSTEGRRRKRPHTTGQAARAERLRYTPASSSYASPDATMTSEVATASGSTPTKMEGEDGATKE